MTAVGEPVRLIEPGATVFSAAEIRVVRCFLLCTCCGQFHSVCCFKGLMQTQMPSQSCVMRHARRLARHDSECSCHSPAGRCPSRQHGRGCLCQLRQSGDGLSPGDTGLRGTLTACLARCRNVDLHHMLHQRTITGYSCRWSWPTCGHSTRRRRRARSTHSPGSRAPCTSTMCRR